MESARVKNYIAVVTRHRNATATTTILSPKLLLSSTGNAHGTYAFPQRRYSTFFISVMARRDACDVNTTCRSRKPRQRENFSFDLDVRFSKRCNPVNRYGRLKHAGCVAETRNHIPRNELIVNVRTIANEISLIYLLHILLDTINRERRNS